MSFQHIHHLRVRYGETDQMGFAYYGVYAQYYEVARVEAMRSIGIHYAAIERDLGIWMPVMHMQARFLRPARYDDLLAIHTQIPAMPDRDIRFRYEIRNENDVLINGAVVQLCFLEASTGKRVNAPGCIKESLISYF